MVARRFRSLRCFARALPLRAWNEWPEELARRKPDAIDEARKEIASRSGHPPRHPVLFLRAVACPAPRLLRSASIRVVGDIAIFVDYDSADVWAIRHLFRLKDDLDPEVVSGVPPDAFSATGQRWGNPLYNWDEMRCSRIPLVDAAPELGHADLRLHSPRPLPRLRPVLGDSRQRSHRHGRPLGGRSAR